MCGKWVLTSVRRGRAGCSVCDVGAMRCLFTHSPLGSESFASASLIEGSQRACLALKSPTTNTGKRADRRGEVSRGYDALVIHVVIFMMSRSVVSCDMYAPPMTIGDGSAGDDTHTNPRRVRDSLGLYVCGMSCNGMNVHESWMYMRMDVGSDGCLKLHAV